MTFETELAKPGRSLRLWFEIEGIPTVFTQAAYDLPSTMVITGRPQSKSIKSIEQGETKLDMRKRRMIGGSLGIQLVDTHDDSLAAIFRPKSRKVTYLTADLNPTATTINVASTTWASASGGYCWIANECVQYTGKTSTTLTGCARERFDTVAYSQWSLGVTGGVAVYDTPPHYLQRKLKLYGYFERNGAPIVSSKKLLRVFAIEQAPSYSYADKVWSIGCSELSDIVDSTKLLRNLREVTPSGGNTGSTNWDVDSADEDYFIGEVRNNMHWAKDSSSDSVCIMSDSDAGNLEGGPAIHQLDSVLISPPRIRIKRGSFLVNDQWDKDHIKSWRTVYFARNKDMARSILELATSDLGDASNGAYDVLPYNPQSTIDFPEWKFGAALRSDAVDAASFIDAANGMKWDYCIPKEIEFGKVLADFCFLTESFWYIDNTGKLAVKSIFAERVVPLLTVDGDNYVAESVKIRYDEQDVIGKLEVKCNYSPVSDDFTGSINIIANETIKRYGTNINDAKEECRAVFVNALVAGEPGEQLIANHHDFTFYNSLFRRIQLQDGRGREVVSFSTDLSTMNACIGDVLILTIPDCITMDGRTGIVERQARIISQRINYDENKVDLECHLQEEVSVVAAAAVIASAAGAVLTLNTTDPCSDSTPGTAFAVGWTVYVYDASVLGVVNVRTVVASTATTITLSSALSFTAAAGDWVTVGAQGLNTGFNPDGISSNEYIYQMPDDENSVLDVSRWQ